MKLKQRVHISSNSEAFASELLEHIEEMFPPKNIDSHSRFKYLTTYWCATRRERVSLITLKGFKHICIELLIIFPKSLFHNFKKNENVNPGNYLCNWCKNNCSSSGRRLVTFRLGRNSSLLLKF